ncbi:MAG: GntR family transcriptional regulator [Bacteroidota bacterium]
MSKLTRAGNHMEPKYKKLAEELIAHIQEGVYGLNDQIPSIKQLSKTYKVSRETVSKALNLLSERGIIKAAYRQGYYVQATDVKVGLRIFFLMDKITEFKSRMYEAFLDKIGDNGVVQIFFHHHNYEVFKSLIINNLPNYTHFVIVTYLEEDTNEILNQIPASKRVIVDNQETGLEGKYAMVYQDFEADIYQCLEEAYPRLLKYKKLVLVSARSRWGADRVLKGFRRFGRERKFDLELVEEISEANISKESVYIFLSNSDRMMVEAIKLCRTLKYEIGKDIGIISYNDTFVNEVLAGGISVLNTDFVEMGKTAAELILNGERKTVVNSSKLILRDSI